jgi:histidinol dehydrogenase
MIAQLEHDCYARAVLVSDSRQILESVRTELSRLVSEAERKAIVSSSYANGTTFVLVKNLADAISLSNAIAPEHLLLDVASPRKLLLKVTNAGSVFLGRWSSVAFGDYCTGTNHILPTNGMAAMRSALSVYDFQKVIPYQLLNRRGAGELSGVVGSLAISEGLPCHARAARTRAGRVSR